MCFCTFRLRSVARFCQKIYFENKERNKEERLHPESMSPLNSISLPKSHHQSGDNQLENEKKLIWVKM